MVTTLTTAPQAATLVDRSGTALATVSTVASSSLGWLVPRVVRAAWAELTVLALALAFGLARVAGRIPRVGRNLFSW